MSNEQAHYRSSDTICLHKNSFLSQAPVFLNRVIVNTPYSPETESSFLHIHDFVEISIVVEGKGIHRTLHQTTECNVGDVYIINVGTPHAYFATDTGECPTICNLIFDPIDILEGDYASVDHSDYCYGIFRKDSLMAYIMLTDNSMADISGILECIERELEGQNYQWQEALKAHLINFLIKTSRYISFDEAVSSNKESKEHFLALSITRKILDHYNDSNLTLQKIAESLFVSPSSAGRAFRKVMGENFADYVRRVRVEKASQLLLETKLTNEQIVYACGLHDVPNFYYQFKKHTGMTPLAYRKQNKSEFLETIHTQKNIENIQDHEGEAIMSILVEISENLQNGKSKIVKGLVEQALGEGISAEVILKEGLLAGMDVVGERFKNNEIYVPEVLVSARAMNMGMEILKPHLAEAGVKARGKVCIGTVQGDLHDIGKNMVKMMLEGKGFEVIDLGKDVAPEVFVQTAIDNDCKIICLSSLLTTTMEVMGDVVKKATEMGIRDKVKILIGGAPVSEEFCKKIGADAYAPDAASAADVAVELCPEV